VIAVLLLVTRPHPDADATAALLRAQGHETLVAPLLERESVAWQIPAGRRFAGVLVTSANTLRATAPSQLTPLHQLPVVAVGRHTAEAARAAGFAEVESADGDAEALARCATARFRGRGQPLLYLAGENRARDVPAMLAQEGITVDTAITYRMRPATTLPAPVKEALAAGRIDGVLHYSRRSAEAYRACAAAAGLDAQALVPVQYCLSDAVAAVFPATGTRVVVAGWPDEESLLALIPR